MLDEGARTMGVWLPLALADVLTLLLGLLRAWSSEPGTIPIPKRSETLASWCLPMLSKSLDEAEKESEALAMYRSVERLAEIQRAKAKKAEKAKKEKAKTDDGSQTDP